MIADALEARNAVLYSLRDIDDNLRSLYPVSEANRERVNRLLHDRDDVCELVRVMGAEVWPWSPKGDNSWLR